MFQRFLIEVCQMVLRYRASRFWEVKCSHFIPAPLEEKGRRRGSLSRMLKERRPLFRQPSKAPRSVGEKTPLWAWFLTSQSWSHTRLSPKWRSTLHVIQKYQVSWYPSRILFGTPYSEFRLCDSKWNKHRLPSVLLSVVFVPSVLRIVTSCVHHRTRCLFSRELQ